MQRIQFRGARAGWILAAALTWAAAALAQPTPTPIVVGTAGDIACAPGDADFNGGLGQNDRCQQMATSDLLVMDPDLDAVLTLGDTQYQSGTLFEFLGSYDPSWGRLKGITYPATGNHEYYDGNSPNIGFFTYFAMGSNLGNANLLEGYYSFDIGNWHFIALNSVCSGQIDLALLGHGVAPDCSENGPQANWLRADLAANADKKCTLAYWHHARFTSGTFNGPHGDGPRAENELWWNLLYDHGAEIVLNGHEHYYERFAPQDVLGNADAEHGIREFIVGTGGKDNDQAFGSPAANSVVRVNGTHGIVRFYLYDDWYRWEFVPAAGQGYSESGTGVCHGPPWPPADAVVAQGFDAGFGAWNAGSCWKVREPQDEMPFHATTNLVASADDDPSGSCDSASGGYLTSPAVDLSSYQSAALSFWYWLDDEIDGGEFLRTEVFDGSSWVQVGYWTDGQQDDRTWRKLQVDLTPYLNPALRVRFAMRANRIWEEAEIDDVAITGLLLDAPSPTATLAFTPTATSLAASTATPTPTTVPFTSTPAALPASCPPVPTSDCQAAPRSYLKLWEPADPSGRQLKWKWLGGNADLDDFGDPLATTGYALCLYDDGTLVAQYGVGAGGGCDGAWCWTESSSGFRYKQRGGNADGIQLVRLKASSGTGKLAVTGKGANLAPLLPLVQSSSVVVQLIKGGGEEGCWTSAFEAPAAASTAAQFQDAAP